MRKCLGIFSLHRPVFFWISVVTSAQNKGYVGKRFKNQQKRIYKGVQNGVTGKGFKKLENNRSKLKRS